MAEQIAIIGAGRVGQALAKALLAARLSLRAILDSEPGRAQECAKSYDPRPVSGPVANLPVGMTLVILCVPDDQISAVAYELLATGKITGDCVVAHTSGALGPEALAPLSPCSAFLASFHPIQTFAGLADDWCRLQGSYFGASGPGPALQRLERIAIALNGHFIRIPGKARIPYHLACVLASNFLVTLASAAMGVLQKTGISGPEAHAMLNPLITTTVTNLARLGPVAALTGPMVRGDAGTVARHCQSIEQDFPEIAELYLALGRQTLHLARQQARLTSSKAVEIENILIDFEGKISQ